MGRRDGVKKIWVCVLFVCVLLCAFVVFLCVCVCVLLCVVCFVLCFLFLCFSGVGLTPEPLTSESRGGKNKHRPPDSCGGGPGWGEGGRLELHGRHVGILVRILALDHTAGEAGTRMVVAT